MEIYISFEEILKYKIKFIHEESKKINKLTTANVRNSAVLQFDLVCDRAIYPTIGLVALNVGGPIGVYLFGTLNDR